MRFPAIATLAALLVLSACGSDGDTTATDPAGHGPSSSRSSVTAVPAAPGTVHTAGLVTVMDTGGAPEVCLGPVAESYPPQCSGPELVGWDWSDHQGTFEAEGEVRWGQFALTGTWDGERLTVTDAISAALYDAARPVDPVHPAPEKDLDVTGLERVRAAAEDLPGALSAYVDGPRVLVDVVYDDGSVQDRVDATYGQGVLVVRPMLVDEESSEQLIS